MVCCTGRQTPANQAIDSTSGAGEVTTGHAGLPDSVANESYERKGPFVENDTTFLYKSVCHQGEYRRYCKAYIEKNRQAPVYRFILSGSSLDSLDEWNANSFKQNLERIKEEHPAPLPLHSLHGCPEAWIPLCSFQGRCYINVLDFYPFWLTDSVYVEQYMDGPMPDLIESSEQPGPARYRFRTAEITLDLHIIDTVRKIAAVMRSDMSHPALYVARETACLFDVVDWDSSEVPMGDEVDWDDIDWRELIPGYGGDTPVQDAGNEEKASFRNGSGKDEGA